VLPNHPLIAQVVSAACQGLAAAHTAEEALEAIYTYLFTHYALSYRFEPPSWERHSQKIRLPHQVLPHFPNTAGQGTCIDLALFIATCLEHLHHHPLIALVDMGNCWHALVGCWTYAKETLEPVLTDASRVMRGTVWADPNGCTQDPDYRWAYERACAEAHTVLCDQPLVYAPDVAAARRIGKVEPLPFVGELQWHADAQQVLMQAEDIGRALCQDVGTVPLWIGLLRLPQGLTQELWRVMGQQPAHDADCLLARLKRLEEPVDGVPKPTPHHAIVMSLARALAKRDGSPLILERHLLQAMLVSPSGATDGALRFLGLSRETLRAALQRLHPLSGISWSRSIFPA
jgi:hypothetical protein